MNQNIQNEYKNSKRDINKKGALSPFFIYMISIN